MKERNVLRILPSRPTRDGDGVRINRVAIGNNMALLDPFLMLDEFRSDEAADYIGGFPSHPHRGFETVTYMLEGRMRHTDHLGNEGLLVSGGVQWMTAGKGVIHAEMPEQSEGRMQGFQLWVNLPAKEKLKPARYQEYAPESIPVVVLPGGGQAKVIAGTLFGTEGPVKDIATKAGYLDIFLPEGSKLALDTPSGHTVLVYVYAGEIGLAGNPVRPGELAQLGDGDSLVIKAGTESRFILLSGKPIGEPIAHYGPFVMNTREEIDQAISDYRAGRLTE